MATIAPLAARDSSIPGHPLSGSARKLAGSISAELAGAQNEIETHLFRTLSIGVPVGLGLWFGLLKLADVLLRHL